MHIKGIIDEYLSLSTPSNSFRALMLMLGLVVVIILKVGKRFTLLVIEYGLFSLKIVVDIFISIIRHFCISLILLNALVVARLILLS